MAIKVTKQIPMEPQQDRFLRAEARRTRKSMSAIVRHAIDVYAELPVGQRLEKKKKKNEKEVADERATA